MRRVRTPEGAKFFGQPIGAPITAGVMKQARHRYGMAALFEAMDREAGFATRNGVPDPQVYNEVTKAISPGGRPADDSPFSSSKTDNWVARAGGLPKYIREVAHALVRSGHPESKAIAMAVGIVRNWAEGKGNVRPQIRAAAAKNIAEWEAKRAKAHVTKIAGPSSDEVMVQGILGQPCPVCGRKHRKGGKMARLHRVVEAK